MAKSQTLAEEQAVFEGNLQLLLKAVQVLIAQNSKQLHYYKGYDFTNSYVVPQNERHLIGYNRPSYTLQNHGRFQDNDGHRTLFYQFTFYHQEKESMKDYSDMSWLAWMDCEKRWISGREIQDKKSLNGLAAELAEQVKKYRVKKCI